MGQVSVSQLEAVASAFEPAPRELLARRELLRRTDTKFWVPPEALGELLGPLADHYQLVTAGSARVAEYRTLYFDTPALRCFHDHRRGRRARHKVRIRHYPDRELSYLELKTKRSISRTAKKRWRIEFLAEELDGAGRQFLAARGPDWLEEQLLPQARTDFSRLTLVSPRNMERVTIDIGLVVESEGRTRRFDDVAIVEVKQAPFCVRTPIMHRIRSARHRPSSGSKYVAAIAATRPQVRLAGLPIGLRALRGQGTEGGDGNKT